MQIKNNALYDLLNYTPSDIKKVNFDMDRYCEAYGEVIDYGTCMNSLMCLNGDMKISAFEELENIKDIERAKRVCKKCMFSNI